MSSELRSPSFPLSHGREHDRSNNVIFWTVLTVIASIAFVIRVYIGSKTYLDFDEWQHVFIASAPRLTDLKFELRTNAHPPLFFWLLRGLLHFGHSPLLYRTISILAGTGSVFLVGLICRKECRSAWVALLSAVAIGLATSAITVSTEVRSYQLSSFFMLVALIAYTEIFPRTDGTRRLYNYPLFALAGLAAIAAHYYAVMFLGACCAAPVLCAVFSRECRARLSLKMNRRPVILFVSALLLPFLLVIKLYVGHASKQPIQGYLNKFYWGFAQHETKVGFLWRNLQNLWNLFSPVEIQTRWIFLAVLAAFGLLIGFWAHRFLKVDQTNPIRVLLILMPILITAELAVLSLADLYPMGGLLRHQYIVQPFFLIAVFVVADVVLQHFRPWVRSSVVLGLGVWSVLHLVWSPNLIIFPGELASRQDFDKYRSVFPQARGIFLDHWSVISYFINTDSEPRHFVRRISGPGLVDQYEVGAGSRPRTEIFYNKLDFTLDLLNADTYRSLAACLQDAGLQEVTLFYFVPGTATLPESPNSMRRAMEELAASQGLKITKAKLDKRSVAAGFAFQ